MLKAINKEIEYKDKPLFWLYRAGSVEYTKINQSHTVFDERSYGFSLFQGYFFDKGISALRYFLKNFFDYDSIPQLSMIAISKQEINDPDSFYYIPRLSLFESILSRGEAVHPCSKMVLQKNPKENDKPSRFNGYTGLFYIPFILQENFKEKIVLKEFSKQIFILDKGMSQEGKIKYLKNNIGFWRIKLHALWSHKIKFLMGLVSIPLIYKLRNWYRAFFKR